MITFGICSVQSSPTEALIDSIRRMNGIQDIEHEIITVGDRPIARDVTNIRFNEYKKPGHITRKKNLITEVAKYDIVCMMHDYLLLDKDWLTVLRSRNDFWDVLQAQIITMEGNRHSDWVASPRHMDKLLERHPELKDELMAVAPDENGARYVCGIPYDVTYLMEHQYISGAYILAKKEVFQNVHFDEDLVWGQEEDLDWSTRVIECGYEFKMEPRMIVRLNKPGKWNVREMTPNAIKKLRALGNVHEQTDNI